MLPKSRKLQYSKDIQQVLQKGSFYSSKNLTAYFLKTRDSKKNRFVVLIGKKNIKSAVKRNRLRRSIYAFIQELISDIKELGQDSIILVRSKEEVSPKELKNELRSLCIKTNLFPKK